MGENDDIKPDAISGDEPVGKDESRSEDTSGLMWQIRLEQEERARNLIERGELSYTTVYGDGEYACVLRGILGDTPQANEEACKQAYREAVARTPEIYVVKRQARSKRNQPPHTPLFIHSPGEQFPGVYKAPPTHITKDEFIDLYSAVCFANGFGVALDTHVIIHWGLLGYTDHAEAAKALQDDFFDHLREWYKYNNEKPEYDVKYPHQLFWIYSHECSQRAGFHTHILAGIPIEMRKAFRKWVKNRVVQLSKNQPVPKGIVKVVGAPSRPIERQWRLLQYLCKGLDPSATVVIAGYEKPMAMSGLIEPSYSNPGHLTCKNRVGVSRNLRRTERDKTGFKSKMEQGIFNKRILYTSILYDSWHIENPGSNSDISLLSI